MVDASVLPDEYRGTLAQARERLPVLNAYAAKAAAVAKLLPGIIGADGRRRYLVIFQNDAELRPTGGFMGSYALVDVNNGRLTQVEIPGGGSYDIQGQMPLKLISPQPLHLVNPHWQFQDANWSPDFPTAAKTITRFFEAGTKTSVDGVIALNIPVVEKLLEIIGPVPMPEYGKTIDHRNFYFETQKAVEIDYDKEANRPKKFLADLAPRIIDKTLKADRGQMIAIAQALDEALRLKQAQLWFRHGDEQQAVGELGWDGAMKTTGGDFLALVHSNIAGQKTDRVMRDEVSHEAKIMADGTTIVTLTLKRVHAGESGALFSGVRNVDFLRVYVPAGSVLVEAKGFTPPDPKLFKIPEPGYAVDGELAAAEESLRVDAASGTRVYVEGGRTVFGNWLQTDPGQSSIATLVYQLPPNAVRILPPERRWLDRLQGRQSESDRLDYRLTIFKQSGADRTTFTQSLDLPRGYILDDETGRTEDDRGRLVTSFPLQSDTELRALLEMP
ncbi:hypothetical protein A3C96_03965 [Candidatus Uhrbacteria bacterium RIFCSPHIGHO2_02_FULL_60_10]|uniref:DUF4012 domain-containing protein n=1 Tax=Candidatus Uhrbacteria bacterium RIFCSPHIGHO2_02_FULL_60_10 TaxID=1802392 RepID=A0A1F7U2G3_9BACT|nr:MAG: hypothetical protein A3C96_03965 [Candidatus Uhrbacteria bacterium RIFCSPHIGHO2_02_FULL_60_10]